MFRRLEINHTGLWRKEKKKKEKAIHDEKEYEERRT